MTPLYWKSYDFLYKFYALSYPIEQIHKGFGETSQHVGFEPAHSGVTHTSGFTLKKKNKITGSSEKNHKQSFQQLNNKLCIINYERKTN